MREVDIALKKISVRKHNAFALRASLHGVKIPLMNPPAAQEPANPIDEQRAESTMAQALERKRREMNAKSK